jgi:hypothetical protein
MIFLAKADTTRAESPALASGSRSRRLSRSLGRDRETGRQTIPINVWPMSGGTRTTRSQSFAYSIKVKRVQWGQQGQRGGRARTPFKPLAHNPTTIGAAAAHSATSELLQLLNSFDSALQTQNRRRFRENLRRHCAALAIGLN